jgi:hypothetical protein
MGLPFRLSAGEFPPSGEKAVAGNSSPAANTVSGELHALPMDGLLLLELPLLELWDPRGGGGEP